MDTARPACRRHAAGKSGRRGRGCARSGTATPLTQTGLLQSFAVLPKQSKGPALLPNWRHKPARAAARQGGARRRRQRRLAQREAPRHSPEEGSQPRRGAAARSRLARGGSRQGRRRRAAARNRAARARPTPAAARGCSAHRSPAAGAGREGIGCRASSSPGSPSRGPAPPHLRLGSQQALEPGLETGEFALEVAHIAAGVSRRWVSRRSQPIAAAVRGASCWAGDAAGARVGMAVGSLWVERENSEACCAVAPVQRGLEPRSLRALWATSKLGIAFL